MPEDTRHISLRLPISIHARVVAKAEAEKRSLNNMVILLLDQATGERAVKDAERKR